MKHSFIIIAILFLGGIIACSDDPAPTSDSSTLIIQPDTLRLLATDSSKTLDLVLSCGCNFAIAISSITGDTNVIKCEPGGTMGDKRSMHSIRCTFMPSLSPPARSSITVNFVATKATSTYTNRAVIVIP